jgi:hypothetical protein
MEKPDFRKALSRVARRRCGRLKTQDPRSFGHKKRKRVMGAVGCLRRAHRRGGRGTRSIVQDFSRLMNSASKSS